MTKRRRPSPVAASRLSVDLAGDWKACTATLPKGCTVLGIVTRGVNTGALVRLAESKNYVLVKDGVVAMLNQSRIEALLEAARRGLAEQEMIPVSEWEQHASRRRGNQR